MPEQPCFDRQRAIADLRRHYVDRKLRWFDEIFGLSEDDKQTITERTLDRVPVAERAAFNLLNQNDECRFVRILEEEAARIIRPRLHD
jgi:hypothetical protein